MVRLDLFFLPCLCEYVAVQSFGADLRRGELPCRAICTTDQTGERWPPRNTNMRRPYNQKRWAEVSRDFTEMERFFVMSADVLAQCGRQFGTQPQDTAFVLALDAAAVLRQFPWLNGPSGLFPEAETAGKIGS